MEMIDFIKMGVTSADILLPKPPNSLSKWAVVACDQYTSEPQYWEAVKEKVGDAPSALHIIYPECFLAEGDARIASIREHMADYRARVLGRACAGFVLVERETTAGLRKGLVMAIDLEQYDYAKGSHSLIRATEQTVESRIPPRVKIRQGAELETPHVMLLVDDPKETLIEPVYAARDTLKLLYDFNLMMDGGHIRGWALSPEATERMRQSLERLYEGCDGLLFAVGDGNHSLATARQCWLDLRMGLSAEQQQNHPARFALVEVCNLHDDALVFEPIHRAVYGADSAMLSHDFVMWCRRNGMSLTATSPERAQMYLLDAPVSIQNSLSPLPVAVLQPFLDEWLSDHPDAWIDYIHGDAALDAQEEKGACCIRLRAMDKRDLFPAIRKGGALPRKTFSMGEAQDKRYYLECRALTKS